MTSPPSPHSHPRARSPIDRPSVEQPIPTAPDRSPPESHRKHRSSQRWLERFRGGRSVLRTFRTFVILSLLALMAVLLSAHWPPSDSGQWQQSVRYGLQTIADWADPIAVPKATPGLEQVTLWRPLAQNLARLGHLPYAKADLTRLVTLQQPDYPNRINSLQPEAAEAFLRMAGAAQAEGIQIVLISGFRDLITQATLFDNRLQVVGSAAEAAKTVAPPGYSEHHTGYAIDVMDGQQMQADFSQTAAFQWMQVHAPAYGFELSFPLNNAQGVAYEPWHWRYVGSPIAAEVFSAAVK